VKANANRRGGLRFRYHPRLKQGSDPHPQGLGLKGFDERGWLHKLSVLFYLKRLEE